MWNLAELLNFSYLVRTPPFMTTLPFRIDSSDVELSVSEVMFFDKSQPVKEEFKNTLLRIYETDVIPIDFHDPLGASAFVNNYVGTKTHGKIREVLQPQEVHNLHLVLISAIFFKGKWKVVFFFNIHRIVDLNEVLFSFLSIQNVLEKPLFSMRAESI